MSIIRDNLNMGIAGFFNFLVAKDNTILEEKNITDAMFSNKIIVVDGLIFLVAYKGYISSHL